MSGRLGLASMDFATQYRTGENDPVEGFYRPCLLNSSEYKRAVGYFRSSIYLIVGSATVEFARRGGRIRLICSPSLTEEDANSIEEGYRLRGDDLERAVSSEIDRLLASENTAYRTRILATLVAAGSMDIRLALRPDAEGLYHEKLGIFLDRLGNRVSFLGSANETWNGWHLRGNHEAIEVFCSWSGGADAERVERHDAYFERLWEGLVPGVETVAFPEAATKRLSAASLGGLEEVDLSAAENISARAREPLPHQISAIEAWKASGRRGLFEHATGSGKTFTALLAIREHVSSGQPVLILVPSRLLLEQWADEIRCEISGAVLLRAGAGNDRWRQPGRLASLTAPSSNQSPRIVLATMQTAATDEFLRGTRGGPHLMVVADEVHQIGSPHFAKAMGIQSGPRLGLSATPVRYGDPEGTKRIHLYFGEVVPPSISLRDAIAAGRLVEYEYHPHPVRLTTSETDAWCALTRKISLEVARHGKDIENGTGLTDRAKLLLIQRSRIAKKAAMKTNLAAEVLQNEYRPGQRWLVYCEDADHLSDVLAALRNVGVNPVEYHTGMTGDRDAALAWFRTFGGVLVSIKCLDEGVDIPSVDHALILSSSQNPRQFIQRRGRVLRKAPDKHLAIIHDAIVVPISLEDEPEQTALLRSEFLRAIEFAGSAINRGASAELRAMAIEIGFNPDDRLDTGFEEE